MGIEGVWELAKLATVGRRLEEADKRYQQLVELTNSSDAWVGLGLVKLERLDEGAANHQEILFCINAAKNTVVSERSEPLEATVSMVESVFCQAITESIIEHISKITQASGMETKLKKRAKISAVLTGMSAFAAVLPSTENSNKTLSRVNLGFMGASATTAVVSLMSADQARSAIDRSWLIVSGLIDVLDEIVSIENEIYGLFLNEYEEAINSLSELSFPIKVPDFAIIHANIHRYRHITGALPSLVACPVCSIKMQLDEQEKQSRRFECPGCKQNIRVDALQG